MISSSSAVVKECPYGCPDFNRFNTCGHEQKVQTKVSRRRSSLNVLFSAFAPSPPTRKHVPLSLPINASEDYHHPPSERSTGWSLGHDNKDEFLDIHYEMMLRDLAVPEITQRALLKQQSAEQKKRLLKLHALYQRTPSDSSPTDWVDKFCNVRACELDLPQIEQVVVHARTANRNALEYFMKSGGIERLASRALDVALIQRKRLEADARLLLGALQAMEYVSLAQLGVKNLIGCDDAMASLALAARPVGVSGSESAYHSAALSMEISRSAIRLLTKLGFASAQGAKSLLKAMQMGTTLLHEAESSFLFLLVRIIKLGALSGEPRSLIDRLSAVDAKLRLETLQFLIAIVEMPSGSRDKILNHLQALGVEEATQKLIQDASIHESLKQEIETQRQLLTALLNGQKEEELNMKKTGGDDTLVNDNKQKNDNDVDGITTTNVSIIPASAVVLTCVVGSGSFGTVHLGTFRGGKVAVKCLHRRDSSAASIILREAQVLGQCQNHPNIVRFFGACFEKDEVRLVFEFCELGSLEDVVVRNPEKSELASVVQYAKQTAAGLAHLHALGVIHRDVAARNVLVDARGACKVSDFGMARIRSMTQSSSSVGKTSSSSNPLKWAAPESLRERIFSRSSDVWMFGIFMWELWYQSIPFPSLDHFAAGCKVAFENLTPTVNDLRGQEAPALMHICQQCWNSLPDRRPSMEGIIEALENIIIIESRAQQEKSSSPRNSRPYDVW